MRPSTSPFVTLSIVGEGELLSDIQEIIWEEPTIGEIPRSTEVAPRDLKQTQEDAEICAGARVAQGTCTHFAQNRRNDAQLRQSAP